MSPVAPRNVYSSTGVILCSTEYSAGLVLE